MGMSESVIVSRYCVTDTETGQSVHPDRLRISNSHGQTLLDISMSGDCPLRPFLDCATPRPWFFTGSPFGAEILAFAKDCGVFGVDQFEAGRK